MKIFNKAIGAMLIFSLASSPVFEAYAQAQAALPFTTRAKLFAARQTIGFGISNFGFMAGMTAHTALLSLVQDNEALRWGVLDTFTDMEKFTSELGSLTAFSLGATLGGKGINLTQYLIPGASHAFYAKHKLMSPAILAYKNMSQTRVGHYGMAIGSLTNNIFSRYWYNPDWGEDKVYLEELGHWAQKKNEIEKKIDSKNWEILGYKSLGVTTKQKQSEAELVPLLAEKEEIEKKLTEYREKSEKVREKIWSHVKNITREDAKEVGVHVLQLLITVELLAQLRSGGSALIKKIRERCEKSNMHRNFCLETIKEKASELAARFKSNPLQFESATQAPLANYGRTTKLATPLQGLRGKAGGAIKSIGRGGKALLSHSLVLSLLNSIWHAVQFLETERHVRDAWEKTVDVENFKRKILESFGPFAATFTNVKSNLSDEYIVQSLVKSSSEVKDKASISAEKIKSVRNNYYDLALSEASKALGAYEKVWEDYREKIIKAEFNYHHMQWQNYFESKYVEMVKTMHYVRWLSRGASLDDEYFKINSEESLKWHHSPDDVGSFEKEKTRYYNAHKEGTNNFDPKKVEEYLEQYEKDIIADLERKAKIMQQQISGIVRGTFYTNQAGVLTRLASLRPNIKSLSDLSWKTLLVGLAGPGATILKAMLDRNEQMPLNLNHSFRSELRGLNDILSSFENQVSAKSLLEKIKSLINEAAGGNRAILHRVRHELKRHLMHYSLKLKVDKAIKTNHPISQIESFQEVVKILNTLNYQVDQRLQEAQDKFDSSVVTIEFDYVSDPEALQKLDESLNKLDLSLLSSTEREELYLVLFAKHALRLIDREIKLPELEQIIYKPVEAIKNPT